MCQKFWFSMRASKTFLYIKRCFKKCRTLKTCYKVVQTCVWPSLLSYFSLFVTSPTAARMFCSSSGWQFTGTPLTLTRVSSLQGRGTMWGRGKEGEWRELRQHETGAREFECISNNAIEETKYINIWTTDRTGTTVGTNELYEAFRNRNLWINTNSAVSNSYVNCTDTMDLTLLVAHTARKAPVKVTHNSCKERNTLHITHNSCNERYTRHVTHHSCRNAPRCTSRTTAAR